MAHSPHAPNGGNVPRVAITRLEHIVLMGVSGSGKTTVAKGIATLTGWTFAEGDAFHPAENVAKMRSGQPLTDEDRWPWLRSLADWISAEAEAGRSAVITCSALRRVYRDLLSEAGPTVRFCHLVADESLTADRLAHRNEHFMPAALLQSQYDTLEPLEADEPGVVVSVEGSAAEVLTRVVEALDLTVPAPQE